ncbi:MAG: CPBP family intramembrane metalloprotease [Lachnospiraceae bacterium]|nr:CPBP family intramembrane metalloprotease [Lachnospiraceae bacterium]
MEEKNMEEKNMEVKTTIHDRIMTLPKWLTVVIVILIVAVFLGILQLGGLAVSQIPVELPGFTKDAMVELVAALVALGLLLLFGYGKIIKQTGEGFVKGFYIGAFLVGQIGMAMVAMLFTSLMLEDVAVEPFWNVLIYTFDMFLVGFAEEVFLRGIALNLLLDRFSKTRGGVWGAVLISSLIFGLAHFVNLLAGAGLESVCVQVIQAAVIGVILAAIYLRSNNIWITIILHALVDWASLMAMGIFGQGDLVDGLGQISRMNLISVPILLIPCFVLMRKNKLDEVVARLKGEPAYAGEYPQMAWMRQNQEGGMVAGISLAVSIIGLCFGIFGMGIGISVAGLLGSITSLKMKKQGNGVAIAALVISIVGICLAILMTFALGWFYYNSSSGELQELMKQMEQSAF